MNNSNNSNNNNKPLLGGGYGDRLLVPQVRVTGQVRRFAGFGWVVGWLGELVPTSLLQEWGVVGGSPHFRELKLSGDLTTLSWTSPKKTSNQSTIDVSYIKAPTHPSAACSFSSF